MPARRRPRRPKPRRRLPPEVLTRAEVLALLAARGDATPAQARDRALLAVLYRAGLRLGEALALEPKDIDPKAGSIRVRRGTGGRDRVVGIDSGGAAILAAWLRRRSEIGHGPIGPVFCTASGRAVTQAYIRRLLPHLAAKAGIAKRVHAHGLRHTYAAELRAEGVDVAVIRKQLGHASLLTTILYLDHLNPVDVLRAGRVRKWIGLAGSKLVSGNLQGGQEEASSEPEAKGEGCTPQAVNGRVLSAVNQGDGAG